MSKTKRSNMNNFLAMAVETLSIEEKYKNMQKDKQNKSIGTNYKNKVNPTKVMLV